VTAWVASSEYPAADQNYGSRERSCPVLLNPRILDDGESPAARSADSAFYASAPILLSRHDGPADPTACQVLNTQFDVLLIDSVSNTWPVAKSARESGGQAAYQGRLIGMEPDENYSWLPSVSGVNGLFVKRCFCFRPRCRCARCLRGEAVCPPQLCSALFRFVAHMIEEIPVKRSAPRPDLLCVSNN